MSKELIKYLRDWDDIPDKDDEAFNWHRELTDKAADTIERLERELSTAQGSRNEPSKNGSGQVDAISKGWRFDHLPRSYKLLPHPAS